MRCFLVIPRFLAVLLLLTGPVAAAEGSLAALKAQAEAGNAVAQNNLAVRYATGEGASRDYERAAHWYRMAGEQGHAIAQHNLGALYEQGLGVPTDLHAAAAWYRMAAEQGDGWAQLSLARVVASETYERRDPIEAYKWGLLALRAADPELRNIGSQFLERLGRDVGHEGIATATQQAAAWSPGRLR